MVAPDQSFMNACDWKNYARNLFVQNFFEATLSEQSAFWEVSETRWNGYLACAITDVVRPFDVTLSCVHEPVDPEVGEGGVLPPPPQPAGAQELPDSANSDLGSGSSHTPEHTKTSSDSQSFPTDSKAKQQEIRRKEKEAGIIREVKKKPKVVEDHWDDCGSDTCSLDNTDVGEAHVGFCASSDDDSDWEYVEDETICDNLQLSFLWGGEVLPHPPLNNLLLVYFTDWEHTLSCLAAKGNGLDLAEICGGEARTTQVGIRRHF